MQMRFDGYGELHRLSNFAFSVSQKPLEVKAIADLACELAGIVPVRAAKRIRIVEEVARVVEILRGEANREAFAERLGERQGKFGVIGKVGWTFAVEEPGAVGDVAGCGDVPRQRRVETEADRVA